MQELNLSRGYLSSVSPRIHFGLGAMKKIDEVIIKWPNGTKQELKDFQVNAYNKIRYDANSASILSEKKSPSSVNQFETVIVEDPLLHKENPYDDFKYEILLPHKNSTLGPALAVGDLNNDNREIILLEVQ